MIEEHPLPWLTPLLNGVEHANFFETRATEYSKGADARATGATCGTSFDSRRKARANDGAEVADEEGGEEDMFAKAGIAAE